MSQEADGMRGQKQQRQKRTGKSARFAGNRLGGEWTKTEGDDENGG